MNKEELYVLLIANPKGNIQERFFKKKFPDIYQDVISWKFPSDFKFTQKLYHYFNNDSQLYLGICPVCHNRCSFVTFSEGYKKHCSTRCSSLDPLVQEKNKKSNFIKYGVEHAAQSNFIKEKAKQTCLNKYGVDYTFQSVNIKNKIKETILKKYGVENVSELPEIREKAKQTTLERYGDEYYCKTKHYQINKSKYIKKGFEVRKCNKSCSTSKIENKLSDYFIQKSISFKTQYYSDVYPYHCDFYLPDYDLYIEIQGTWAHGFHPFDINNKDDINKLNIWKEKSKTSKFYKYSIKVWTNKDVVKRETAKKNNLNYLEIFSIDFDYCVGQILNRIKSGS